MGGVNTISPCLQGQKRFLKSQERSITVNTVKNGQYGKHDKKNGQKRSKAVKNGNKTVKTVMVLGRSTIMLGRSTMVL